MSAPSRSRIVLSPFFCICYPSLWLPLPVAHGLHFRPNEPTVSALATHDWMLQRFPPCICCHMQDPCKFRCWHREIRTSRCLFWLVSHPLSSVCDFWTLLHCLVSSSTSLLFHLVVRLTARLPSSLPVSVCRDLSYNDFTGSIPAEIGALPSIQFL